MYSAYSQNSMVGLFFRLRPYSHFPLKAKNVWPIIADKRPILLCLHFIYTCCSLGPLVNKVKEFQVETIVDTLCSNMLSDKEQLRDISSIGELKSWFNCFHRWVANTLDWFVSLLGGHGRIQWRLNGYKLSV